MSPFSVPAHDGVAKTEKSARELRLSSSCHCLLARPPFFPRNSRSGNLREYAVRRTLDRSTLLADEARGWEAVELTTSANLLRPARSDPRKQGMQRCNLQCPGPEF